MIFRVKKIVDLWYFCVLNFKSLLLQVVPTFLNLVKSYIPYCETKNMTLSLTFINLLLYRPMPDYNDSKIPTLLLLLHLNSTIFLGL